MLNALFDQDIQALDRSSHLELICSAPQAAVQVLEQPKLPSAPAYLICGMGGSGSTGDMFQALFPQKKVYTHKNGCLPEYLPEGILVICISYSGNTAETLACFETAQERGLDLAVLTSGGTLAQRAEDLAIPHLKIRGGKPPRSALFEMLFALLSAAGEPREKLESSLDFLETLKEKWSHFSREPLPLALARKHQAYTPLLWSTDALSPITRRWKNQLAENAKVFASDNQWPEANHNEIVALCAQQNPDKSLLYLSLSAPSPEEQISLDLLSEHLARVEAIQAEGSDRFQQLLYLIYLADFTSVYWAFLKGVDPTPIAPIDILKRNLAQLKSS